MGKPSLRLAFTLVFCSICLIPVTQIAILWALPTNFWFEYHSIDPMKEEYVLEERPQFASVVQIYRTVNFEWSDILFCDFGEGFIYYSAYPSARNDVPKTIQPKTSKWYYQGVVPNYPSTCYLESNIAHVDWYGIHKKQKHISDFFQFGL